MALSDKLFDVYTELKEAYQHYCSDDFYSKDVKDETEDILTRIDTLRGKLDANVYRGSMRYDDKGEWQKHMQRVWKYQIEVQELAGDISDIKLDDDEIAWNGAQEKWMKAMKKIEMDGNKDKLAAIEKKYFN